MVVRNLTGAQASRGTSCRSDRHGESRMISSAFWRDRRVFNAGHTAFKGAWLSLMLDRLNARTTGYGPPPATNPSLYDLADAGAALCDVRGDMADASLLDGALRAADPDIVIHLATRAPRASITDSREDLDSAVIEAIACAPSVQAALIVSPDALAVAVDYRILADHGARVLAIHCPDPAGGGNFASTGALSSLHVLDAAFGLLLLAQSACEGAALDRDWTFARSAHFDARFTAPNTALGCTPLLDATEAAQWTAEWRAAYAAGDDMRAVTREQIDRYLGQRVQLTSPFTDMRDDLDFRAVA